MKSDRVRRFLIVAAIFLATFVIEASLREFLDGKIAEPVPFGPLTFESLRVPDPSPPDAPIGATQRAMLGFIFVSAVLGTVLFRARTMNRLVLFGGAIVLARNLVDLIDRLRFDALRNYVRLGELPVGGVTDVLAIAGGPMLIVGLVFLERDRRRARVAEAVSRLR